MTAENVERARAAWLGATDLFELLARGPESVAEIFPALHPRVTTEFIGQSPELAVSYEGIDGLYEGWRDWLGPWSSYVIRMDDVYDTDTNDVVVAGSAAARTSRDGVLMEHRPAAILTFDEDGLITRVRFYVEVTDALRAAGLAD